MTNQPPADRIRPANSHHPGSPVRPQLRLLGKFRLDGYGAVTLGGAAQRLLALLAVQPGSIARWQAAQTLYPETTGARAAQSLRSALWRLQRCCPRLVDTSTTDLVLSPHVAVDYRIAEAAAQRQLDPSLTPDPDELRETLRVQLREDLLPDWPDAWLVTERERFRQLRLHALEALCHRLVAAGWHGAAVDVGLAAVAADPLRESAHRSLIEAYLAEGNHTEALRQFHACRASLRRELGVEPSDRLRRLIAHPSNRRRQ